MNDLPSQRTVRVNGAPKPEGAVSSVFDIAKKPAKPRAPAFDPNAVVIRQGVPMPDNGRGKHQQDRYGVLLRKMQPGDMVELLTRQAFNMSSRARKLGIKVAVRVLAPGRSGVWRLADED